MDQSGYTLLLHRRFVRSLRYEDDTDFRTLMAYHVNRGIGLLGVLGLAVVALYLVSQVFLLGKEPVWRYGLFAAAEVTVLWDKLAMTVVMAAAVGVRTLWRPLQPIVGRVIVLLGGLLVTVAIVLDDAASGNVSFSPAYVAVVLLAITIAVPFKPFHSMLTALLIFAGWWVTVELIPEAAGMVAQDASGAHILFLSIIVVLATGISGVLYEIRYSEFKALRRSQGLVADLDNALRSLTEAQTRLIHAAKMASLGRFVSGVAHELRNPLNFVANFSRMTNELILEIAENRHDAEDWLADVKSNLEMICKHADRADSLVTELIGHSDSATGKQQPTELNELVKNEVDEAKAKWEFSSNHTKVYAEYDPDVGMVDANATQLVRAVRSVLENALTATSLGGNSESSIWVSTTIRERDAVITVRDNGVGMTNEMIDQMFEPFFTGWNSGTHTGLGLSIAYEIITEGHAGSIDVESRLGEGTTVRLIIPAVTAAAS